ncbi:hypothetical protein BLX87_20580 [Bacillus sp. VT-16-64]|nr:hypothetical protein BLX87_20580 [Bacillus sp. VT-16-64]
MISRGFILTIFTNMNQLSTYVPAPSQEKLKQECTQKELGSIHQRDWLVFSLSFDDQAVSARLGMMN